MTAVGGLMRQPAPVAAGAAAVVARVRSVGRFRPDWFVVSLLGAVVLATVWPCHGDGARLVKILAEWSIAALFFLQGARLSRDAVLAGIMNWKLHLLVFATTFVVFPLAILALLPGLRAVLPPALCAGLLFLSALPSVNQSSVALTSIGSGNVAGAVCAAAGSNMIGLILTPVLLSFLLRFSSIPFQFGGLWNVILGLLGPFVLGHLLRPWIGGWADRNRKMLAVTDRSSVLLVVYSVFSAAVVGGIWAQLQFYSLASVALIDGVLLLLVLIGTTHVSRLSGMPQSDEIAVVFCGSTKSLVTGIPIANALFDPSLAATILIPIMLYHQLQLLICAWVARRYAKSSSGPVAEKIKKAA